MELTSAELNAGIEALEDAAAAVRPGSIGDILGLGGESKPIFYFGWWWRRVDFDADIWLSVNRDGVTGFDEARKWDMPNFLLSPDEKAHLIELIDHAITERTSEACGAVNGYMLDLGRPHIEVTASIGGPGVMTIV